MSSFRLNKRFRLPENKHGCISLEIEPENFTSSCVTGRFFLESNCVCKDHRNEIEAPDPVVKDLISYKIMERFDKKARLINGTETTIFVKYSIFQKAQPFFFRVLILSVKALKKKGCAFRNIVFLKYFGAAASPGVCTPGTRFASRQILADSFVRNSGKCL